MKKCDCNERVGTKINSWRQFEELKDFFDSQVENGIFSEIPVTQPFYIGYDEDGSMKWYANKWYKCNNCGCLWELNYPDFPAAGFVRKFPGGEYKKQD